MQKICMIGTGYVGLVTGACLADFGNRVICVDLDEKKIELLRAGVMPFYEFSLGEVVDRNVREGRLTFTTDLPKAIRDKVIFIAVGTPQSETGEADLSQVLCAARTIAENMNGYKLVVQKSTVPVGTGEKVCAHRRVQPAKKTPFDVASNPEFLREGSAVEDFMRPDRVVIGTWSKKAEAILSEIYRPLYLSETPMVQTTVQTAELIKYASNAFLATKISFINEMANLCEVLGRRRQDRGQGAWGWTSGSARSSSTPAPATAAPASPRTRWPSPALAARRAAPAGSSRSTIEVNRRQRMRMMDKIVASAVPQRAGPPSPCSVCPSSRRPTMSATRSASTWSGRLRRRGAKVRAFDPVAMEGAAEELSKSVYFCEDSYDARRGSEVLVIATEWNEFRMLDLAKIRRILKSPVLVDCRNIYEPAEDGSRRIPLRRRRPWSRVPSDHGPKARKGRKMIDGVVTQAAQGDPRRAGLPDGDHPRGRSLLREVRADAT